MVVGIRFDILAVTSRDRMTYLQQKASEKNLLASLNLLEN